jgi:hypothetical protein
MICSDFTFDRSSIGPPVSENYAVRAKDGRSKMDIEKFQDDASFFQNPAASHFTITCWIYPTDSGIFAVHFVACPRSRKRIFRRG